MSRALRAVLAVLAAAAPAAAQPPVLEGWVLPADGGPPEGVRVRVHWPGYAAAPAPVDAGGRFRVELPPGAPDTVEVRVDAADPAARRYHPSVARVARTGAPREASFVLAPVAWTIPAGTHAGRTVPISPARASTPPCPGCSAFWPRLEATGPLRFQLWPGPRFPLRIAFDRQHAAPAGTAPDSAAFWGTVDAMEAAFGQDLFRPIAYAATLPRGGRPGPDGVVAVVMDAALPASGLTTLLGRAGALEHAVVRLRDPRVVAGAQGAELVVHELMHVLGVGHTCAWRSVTADLRRCPQRRAPLPTAEDVAYTQLLYRVRHLQLSGDARWGLDAALAGEAELPRRPARGLQEGAAAATLQAVSPSAGPAGALRPALLLSPLFLENVP